MEGLVKGGLGPVPKRSRGQQLGEGHSTASPVPLNTWAVAPGTPLTKPQSENVDGGPH